MSFIKNVNKYYGSKEDVNKLIRYCGNSVSVKNCGFFGVNPLSYIDAIESMYRIKKRFNQENGQQVLHFVVSIYRKSNSDMDHLIMYAENVMNKIGYQLEGMGFQNIAFIHAKRAKIYEAEIGSPNVHIHFVVNTINVFTGHRMRNVKNILNYFLSQLKRDDFFKSLNWEYVTMG